MDSIPTLKSEINSGNFVSVHGAGHMTWPWFSTHKRSLVLIVPKSSQELEGIRFEMPGTLKKTKKIGARRSSSLPIIERSDAAFNPGREAILGIRIFALGGTMQAKLFDSRRFQSRSRGVPEQNSNRSSIWAGTRL